MKKYYVIELQGRDEVEGVGVVEVKSVKDLVKLKKKQLVDSLKKEGSSSSEIKDYVEEWFMSEEYSCGIDICLGEEWSFVCIDMESDLFSKVQEGDDYDLSDGTVADELLEGFWDSDLV